MTVLPLPKQSQSLSPEGFNALYHSVRNNPAVAKQIADLIQADPKGALEYAFRLTVNQKIAIENATPADLLHRADALLKQLRSASPGSVTFGFDKPSPTVPGAATENLQFSCSCSIK
ncbi:MAG TPA: hypothetical protein VGG92_22195 [Caulobacteraceae bacterium]|jgi:hypothetical protein